MEWGDDTNAEATAEKDDEVERDALSPSKGGRGGGGGISRDPRPWTIDGGEDGLFPELPLELARSIIYTRKINKANLF